MADTVEIPALSEQQLLKLKADHSDCIAFDDRGNAVWQFSEDSSYESDSGSRSPTLEHPALAIVDEEPPASSTTARVNAKGLRDGYNPYDSGQLTGRFRRKAADLRELSKWIELRRKLEQGERDK